MLIHVTSAYSDPEPIQLFRSLAAFGKRHRPVEHAAEADAILFVENSHYHDDAFFSRLKNHPLVRRYRERCFMYNEHDRPWCILPGVYCSMPRHRFDHRRQRATRYIRLLNPVDSRPSDQPDILFSFIGNSQMPVRRQILQLRSSRAILEESSSFNPFFSTGTTDRHVRYAEILRRSKFIVCPRGCGTSSIRLFETLRAGRVPIIVADQWIAPEGPDWCSCSLRVSERDVAQIEALATQAEPRWSEMAANAHRIWNEWFADEVLFDRVGDALENIVKHRLISEQIMQRIPSISEWDWRLRRGVHLLHSQWLRMTSRNNPIVIDKRPMPSSAIQMTEAKR
jgi:hypothetical protein